MRWDAIIVGVRKVNGFHDSLQFWSFRANARLASGFGKTRHLLVKCVKGLVGPYFEIHECLLK